MDRETIKITKVTGKCPACEDYSEKNSTTPPKIAVMACEGACARGEVARRAANLVAHRLATDSTVRICLGGAFTKDTGQRNLVRRAERVIAIEGCFINCSSRMMEGVLPELKPEIVRADLIYNLDLPFGIDEVPDEMFTIYAHQVAERVVRDSLKGSAAPATSKPPACGTGPAPADCGCSTAPVSCSAGPACSTKNTDTPQYLTADVVNVRWGGKTAFHAENTRGGTLVMDDGPANCSAVEVLMASLGGCVSTALLGQLLKDEAGVRALQVNVAGTRKAGLPAAYEKIHVVFSLEVNRKDAILEVMIRQAMTVLCPVAVTLGLAAEVTWEFRRMKAD
ncbi:putative zinc-binding protein [Methanoregula sp.]|uniref:putative zinc-binding protein n=1 Tax=Methanoregula sp. TaxID=2052170 RepID=UPI00356A7034